MEPAPAVLLHPSVIERFTAHSPGLSGSARRTLRTNLRFLARQVVPHLDPADKPLPREIAQPASFPAAHSRFLARSRPPGAAAVTTWRANTAARGDIAGDAVACCCHERPYPADFPQ